MYAKVIQPYLRALRPRQWTKNLVVFAAPLFAFKLQGLALLGSALALLVFCAISSGFYLINDLLDVDSDRQHPVKCKRPIAAGLIPIPVAIGLAAVLLLGSLSIAWFYRYGLGAAITGYALLQIAYNLKLKHKIIADIIAIAMGFVLRAYGGAAAAGIELSPWFLLCTAMLALFLGIEKRKAELRLGQSKGGRLRPVLYRYTPELLNRMESTVTTGTIMAYALWSAGPNLKGASTPWMMLTLPFVLYGVFRYQFLSDPQEISARSGEDRGGQTERPEEVLLRDLPILLTVMGWVLSVFVILYLKSQGWIH